MRLTNSVASCRENQDADRQIVEQAGVDVARNPAGIAAAGLALRRPWSNRPSARSGCRVGRRLVRVERFGNSAKRDPFAARQAVRFGRLLRAPVPGRRNDIGCAGSAPLRRLRSAVGRFTRVGGNGRRAVFRVAGGVRRHRPAEEMSDSDGRGGAFTLVRCSAGVCIFAVRQCFATLFARSQNAEATVTGVDAAFVHRKGGEFNRHADAGDLRRPVAADPAPLAEPVKRGMDTAVAIDASSRSATSRHVRPRISALALADGSGEFVRHECETVIAVDLPQEADRRRDGRG